MSACGRWPFDTPPDKGPWWPACPPLPLPAGWLPGHTRTPSLWTPPSQGYSASKRKKVTIIIIINIISKAQILEKAFSALQRTWREVGELANVHVQKSNKQSKDQIYTLSYHTHIKSNWAESEWSSHSELFAVNTVTTAGGVVTNYHMTGLKLKFNKPTHAPKDRNKWMKYYCRKPECTFLSWSLPVKYLWYINKYFLWTQYTTYYRRYNVRGEIWLKLRTPDIRHTATPQNSSTFLHVPSVKTCEYQTKCLNQRQGNRGEDAVQAGRVLTPEARE